MKFSKSAEMKAEMLNKLQSLTTLLELLSQGKAPSKELLEAARLDLQAMVRLLRGR